MKNSSIYWQSVPMDMLSDVLFGIESPKTKRSKSFNSLKIKSDEVAVGFSSTDHSSNTGCPNILILNEDSYIETFSWLRVYAPNISPLSLFSRVMSVDDWFKFNDSISPSNQNEDLWASVILGEVIAQSESSIDLMSIPLSRASGCFTTAILRTISIHGDTAMQTCISRLKQVELDGRFVKRPVLVDQLIPIWNILKYEYREQLSLFDAVDTVLKCAIKYTNSDASFFDETNSSEYKKLFSDSVEERVLAFNKIVNYLHGLNENVSNNAFYSALIAVAAFLVGRSTSHEFLLRRVIKTFPAVTVWYGLIAALAGPLTWDINWVRAVRGIRKQSAARFDWINSSGFDICWLEFYWLSKAVNKTDVFLTFPKLIQKVISIEILPGVVCQFRLVSDVSLDVEPHILQQTLDREKELRITLSQFVDLANKTRNLLDVDQNYEKKNRDFVKNEALYPKYQRYKDKL